MKFLPIVDRELRVAARRPGTQWMRFGVALALMLLVPVVLAFSPRFASPSRLAQELFQMMGIPTLAFCLLAGVFLTSDCLSEEKREGTLGLLFLTDLKGYDVTLGKLAATSLHALYGLLAAFPVMALPLLMGGVSAGEFGRLILVLLVTLFLSLSVGMMVSAVSRETRQAMMASFAILVLLAGGFPSVWALQRLILQSGPVVDALLLPSPYWAYLQCFDDFYRTSGGAFHFWTSLSFSGVLGLALLVGASWLLPKTWPERELASAPAGRQSLWQTLRYGTRQRRAIRRARLADNPFYWLASRDRLAKVLGWAVVGCLGALWLCFFVGSFVARRGSQADYILLVSFLLAYGLHVIFKTLVAVEASRRLSDDRQSGTLELLLATPLSVPAIVEGQQRALREQFRHPLLAVALVNVALFWQLAFPNPIGMPAKPQTLFCGIFLGGLVLLWSDYYALTWIGMAQALRRRRHHRAVLATLGRMLVPPWIGMFLLFMLANMVRGRMREDTAIAILVVWFFVSVIDDVLAASKARAQLVDKFRSLAAGDKVTDSQTRPPVLAPVSS